MRGREGRECGGSGGAAEAGGWNPGMKERIVDKIEASRVLSRPLGGARGPQRNEMLARTHDACAYGVTGSLVFVIP